VSAHIRTTSENNADFFYLTLAVIPLDDINSIILNSSNTKKTVFVHTIGFRNPRYF